MAKVKVSAQVAYNVELTEDEAIMLTTFMVKHMPADIGAEPGNTLSRIWQSINSAIINTNSRHIDGGN